MSVSWAIFDVSAAVRAGLNASLSPLQGAVFGPPDPEGDYDRKGSAWVAKAKSTGEIGRASCRERVYSGV